LGIPALPINTITVNRRCCIVVAVSCAALLAACTAAPVIIRFYLHFIVSQVLHGVSEGKTLFLLAFLAVFFTRLALVRGPHAAPSRRAAILFLVVAGAGLAAALASCLFYMRAYDLPVDWHSFHWRQGINSVNHIAHIHTSKSALALGIELCGWHGLHERFDTGAAYLGAVPTWLAAVIGLFFVAALILALVAGPAVLRPYPQAQMPWVAVVLGLALATVSKSILDGGPLAYDAVAGLLAVAVLIQADSIEAVFRLMARRCLLLVLVVALWAAIVAAADWGVLAFQAQNLCYRLAVYGLLLAVPRMWTAGQASRRDWIRLAVCGGLAVVFAGWNVYSELLPLWRAAPAGVIRYDFPENAPDGTPVDMESFASATVVPVGPGESYLNAYLRLGEKPGRIRRVSAAPRPEKPTGFYADLIILSTAERSQELRPTPILQIRRADIVAAGRHPRLRVQVEFPPSLGPVLYAPGSSGGDQLAENERFMGYILLDRYLARAGVSEYVLVPLAQYAQK
jgi:hypothetical protein